MKAKLIELGTIRASTQTRKMVVNKKATGFEFLMLRWSTETHTFVTAWGEFGPTLNDVAVMASPPILGDALRVEVTN